MSETPPSGTGAPGSGVPATGHPLDAADPERVRRAVSVADDRPSRGPRVGDRIAGLIRRPTTGGRTDGAAERPA
ncbi:hypothetical protein U4E84_02540 [Halorubrum sp. AD140]|uniref:hypothetical protein n=1 Tax=Halorubrum sp. AD140 TaxID=3050073 RepID=UPI002ACC4E28|nr:hypothetical protein [Halorubrum sp. AD140]MDZ5810234.1 hypothetical protein [Halorubrum sp. AD140]